MSELDRPGSWFLEHLVFVDGDLVLDVVEATLGPWEPHPELPIEGPTRELLPEGQRLRVIFSDPVTWHVTDESYTTGGPEDKEAPTLRTYESSPFHEYVDAQLGWYAQVAGRRGTHYQLVTLDVVVDVLALEPPTIVTRPR